MSPRSAVFCMLAALFCQGCQQDFHSVPRQIVWVNGASSFPVSISKSGIVVLNWTVEGQQTMAVVDTGATGLIVSREFANKHHLNITSDPDGYAVDATGKHHSLEVVHLDKFELPGVVLRDLNAVVMDFGPMRRETDAKLDVFLGRAVFERTTLTIDYAARRVTLDPTPLPPSNGRDILPLKRGGNHEWMAPLTLENKQTWFIVDTGWCCCDLVAPAKLLAGNFATTRPDGQITAFYGKATAHRGTVKGPLILGEHTILGPIEVESLENDEPGILATGALRRFVVTIDARNMLIRFALPAASR